MDQLHRRWSNEQAKVLLQSYHHGKITRADLQEILGIGKTRLFSLLKSYRHTLPHLPQVPRGDVRHFLH